MESRAGEEFFPHTSTFKFFQVQKHMCCCFRDNFMNHKVLQYNPGQVDSKYFK